LALVAFSAFHAYRVSDDTIRNTIAPPPFYSIRFVLYPNHRIEGVQDLGFKPGWIVTYAPRGPTYGTAFFVPVYGRMAVSGMPCIVAKQHQQAKDNIETFRQAFARLDSTVQAGTVFSNVVSILGRPITTMTNTDGTLEVFYDYMPSSLDYAKVDWLTNGFTLLVSNGIVIMKGYSFTSH
jgi:hypothetical protein